LADNGAGCTTDDGTNDGAFGRSAYSFTDSGTRGTTRSGTDDSAFFRVAQALAARGEDHGDGQC